MDEAKSQTLSLNIPNWGMDLAGYESACRYLGLSSDPTLHDKVARYLLLTAATHPSPTGFGRWLAELRPGRLSLGFLDVWTRLLMPSHPWRYRLNAILAVHECDPRGFREMMAQPESRIGTWLSFARISATAFLNLILGGVWLCGQACAYAATGRGLRRERAYFAGKTVLVTGATRGLGLALSARLLSLGTNVVAVVRASPALEALHSQIADAGLEKRFQIATADVAIHGALSTALAEIGVDAADIDMAVINAGIKEESSLPGTDEALKRVFGVNVFGAMDTAAALLPAFRVRGRGHLIFISSLGRWHGMPASGSYNASKAALSLLVESLAMDLRNDGRKAIRITSVEPGLIRTGMVAGGTLQDLLAVDAETAARNILQCAARGCQICRFPFLFTSMTAMIAALPMGLRVRILGRVRNRK
ncbi:MAG: SDR family NAD(P)-dependent oxidoreductase [Thiobacillus sp.]|nr:SDR family NAD(P)-dependent oxidoreductase [Thiobacillus sp.]